MWVKIDRHNRNRRMDDDDGAITLWVFRMIEPYERRNQSNHRLLDKVSSETCFIDCSHCNSEALLCSIS